MKSSSAVDHTMLLFCEIASYDTKGLKNLSEEDELGYNHYKECKDLLAQIGWKKLNSSEEIKDSTLEKLFLDHGYFGVAYYKEVNSALILAFSHRGTCFDKMGNILADIKIAQRENPDILQCAEAYITHICSKIDRPITLLYHTGFSLGGFIAGAIAAKSICLDTSSTVWAITFDAPGIKSLKFDEEKLKERITNYVTVPNLVNTCNGHVGEVRKVGNFPEIKTKEPINFKLDLTNLGISDYLLASSKDSFGKYVEKSNKITSLFSALTELTSTLSSHSRKNIFDCIVDNCITYQSVYFWPIAENTFIDDEQLTSKQILSPKDLENFFYRMSLSVLILKEGSLKEFFMAMFYMRIKGIEHFRTNTIFYHEDQAAKEIVGFFDAICQVAFSKSPAMPSATGASSNPFAIMPSSKQGSKPASPSGSTSTKTMEISFPGK